MPCACIPVYHVVRLNTCTLHQSAGSMFEIDFQSGQTFFRLELNFQILKLYLRFTPYVSSQIILTIVKSKIAPYKFAYLSMVKNI